MGTPADIVQDALDASGASGAAPADDQADDGLPSLEDALREEFDRIEDPDAAADALEGTDDQSGDKAQPGSEEDPGAAAAEDDKDSKATKPDGVIRSPASWGPGNKELFEKLAQTEPELAKQVADREAERERTVNRVLEETAGIRKLMEPYNGQLSAAGLTNEAWLQQMINAQLYLTSKPVEALGWLAGNYIKDADAARTVIRALAEKHGVTLGDDAAPDGGGVLPGPDGAVDREAREELARLRRESEERNRRDNEVAEAARSEQQQRYQQEVEAFAKATDEYGNLKHPHFDTVRDSMGKLILAQEADDYESAYEMAVWQNPETRKAMISAAKANSSGDSRVRRARSSTTPRGSGRGASDTAGEVGHDTLEDELNAQFDRVAADR